ncbi:hypothetical protein LV779_08500 [Streptomyces thinghirensis]|nr:hypothetical protein [Streptomyces thinghirensis]
MTLEWKPPGTLGLLPRAELRPGHRRRRRTGHGPPAPSSASGTDTPGDGLPLDGVHPDYTLTDLRPDGFEPQVTGMDWLPDGRTASPRGAAPTRPRARVYTPRQRHRRDRSRQGDGEEGRERPQGDPWASRPSTGPCTCRRSTRAHRAARHRRRRRHRQRGAPSRPAVPQLPRVRLGLLYHDRHFYLNLSVAIN